MAAAFFFGGKESVWAQAPFVHPLSRPLNTQSPLLEPVTTLPITGQVGEGTALCIADSKLYIPNSTQGTVSVIDLRSNTVVATITGLSDVRSFVAVPQYGKGFAALGTTNEIAVIDMETQKITAMLEIEQEPVTLFYARKSDVVYVTGRDNQVTLIDPKKARIAGHFMLDGVPSQACEDTASGDLYQAVPDRNEIAVIDLKRKHIEKLFRLPGSEAPVGLALDSQNELLCVPCRSGLVFLLDKYQGGIKTTLSLSETGAGRAEYDELLGRLYIANDDGLIPIRKTAYQTWNVEEESQIPGGAISCVIDPTSHSLYALQAKAVGVYCASHPIKPRFLDEPNIIIPDSLRRERFAVEVKLNVLVHLDGTPEVEVTQKTRYPELDKAVQKAMLAARFVPAFDHGHPIEASLHITIPISQD